MYAVKYFPDIYLKFTYVKFVSAFRRRHNPGVFIYSSLIRSSPPTGDHRQNVTTSQGEKCAASATYGSGTLTRLAGLSFHVPTSSTRSTAPRESVNRTERVHVHVQCLVL